MKLVAYAIVHKSSTPENPVWYMVTGYFDLSTIGVGYTTYRVEFDVPFNVITVEGKVEEVK